MSLCVLIGRLDPQLHSVNLSGKFHLYYFLNGCWQQRPLTQTLLLSRFPEHSCQIQQHSGFQTFRAVKDIIGIVKVKLAVVKEKGPSRTKRLSPGPSLPLSFRG